MRPIGCPEKSVPDYNQHFVISEKSEDLITLMSWPTAEMAQPDEESMTDSDSLLGIHRGKSWCFYNAKSFGIRLS
jgi:hypothetical protein